MRALLRSILVLSLVSVAGFAAAQSARTIETTPDADYFGFDLRAEKNVSQAQCEKLCTDSKYCKAFTYNIKAQWCFLKSDYDTIKPAPGAVAGRVVEKAAEPDIGAPPRLAFISSWMQQNARDFANGLDVPEEDSSKTLAVLSSEAAAATAANDSARAFILYKAIAVAEPDKALGWLGAARVALGVTDNSISATDAVSAAFNGYQRTRTAKERASALSVLAQALEKTSEFRPALEAYKASLKLAEVKSVRVAYAALHEKQGFRMVEHTIDSDTASPRACVQFSEPLLKSGTDYSSFVTLDGAVPSALEAKDNQICVEGLTHGARYKLALARRPAILRRAKASKGAVSISKSMSATVQASAIRFTGDSFVLPSTARRGDSAWFRSTPGIAPTLKLYRIGDRNVAPLACRLASFSPSSTATAL